jgi:hypothetical protein
MTLTELRYIVTLAQEQHFGRAAERCFVSQPTLSIAVKKLEEELGVALFERSKSRVAATPLGEQIVAQAQLVLEQTAAIKDLANAGKDQLSSPLRVGAIFTIGPYLLPHFIPQLQKMASKMPLYVEEGYTGPQLQAPPQREGGVRVGGGSLGSEITIDSDTAIDDAGDAALGDVIKAAKEQLRALPDGLTVLWPLVLGMAIGGMAAAPLAAWLTRKIPTAALGATIGFLVILLNLRTFAGSIELPGLITLSVAVPVIAAWIGSLIVQARRRSQQPALADVTS